MNRGNATPDTGIKAVLWDFGGVILSSPFDAFRQYEERCGLPRDFLRKVNATNPHTNAWACFERGEIDAERFGEMFLAESTALGFPVHGRDLLPLISGEIRPRMVQALRQVKARYKIACLTNNMPLGHGPAMAISPEKAKAVAEVMALFDCVVESSKVGVRKPEPAFYERACSLLGIQPSEAVFLDDLGINLKPAAAMGMKTIKVEDPDTALQQLGAIIGMEFAA
ncbi:HAD-IA family hydrolase [uncultured Ferrovibrio sp.]|jgi:putative hydrolase of the HAD superfamily|uniref:HAD-IA family hydrolase n=1 Tax=uncultured Ferrovibrio sp. TaxID=1576913 RepID=UPI002601D1EA|nr:HAD-IA family hydrolase [uncultured Ferrovibrio sp.]